MPALAIGLVLAAGVAATVVLVREDPPPGRAGGRGCLAARMPSVLSFAGCLFLVLRGRQFRAEVKALGALGMAAGCFGLELLVALPYLDRGIERQSRIDVPLRLLDMALFGSAVASGGLLCTAERPWVRLVGAWGMLLVLSVVLVPMLG